MNNRQIEEKYEKIKIALERYKEAKNLSDLSKLTGIPTSSLQRYLKDDSKKLVGQAEYGKIVEWLSNAKLNGLKNGGKKSQNTHGFSKDENGHFLGSGK